MHGNVETYEDIKLNEELYVPAPDVNGYFPEVDLRGRYMNIYFKDHLNMCDLDPVRMHSQARWVLCSKSAVYSLLEDCVFTQIVGFCVRSMDTNEHRIAIMTIMMKAVF